MTFIPSAASWKSIFGLIVAQPFTADCLSLGRRRRELRVTKPSDGTYQIVGVSESHSRERFLVITHRSNEFFRSLFRYFYGLAPAHHLLGQPLRVSARLAGMHGGCAYRRSLAPGQSCKRHRRTRLLEWVHLS